MNSNLLYSLYPSPDYLICLATTGISLNNSSWPGALALTNQKTFQLQRLSLFPSAAQMQTVFGAPAFSHSEFLRVLPAAEALSVSTDPEATVNAIKAISESIFSFSDFSSQAAVLSSKLWQLYFPLARPLVYLPLEDVIHTILTKLLGDAQSLFARLFFSEHGRQLLIKYFHGVAGGFTGPYKGSFLFWGVDERGHRIHLQLDSNGLRGGAFYLPLNPSDVLSAIANRRIYPTSLVCFLVLLYCKITCLGGFNQTSWLKIIQEKFLLLLAEMGETAIANTVQKIAPDNFAETTLAFLQAQGRVFPATGMDILFERDPSLYLRYKHLAQKLSVGESVDLSLPEIYKVITHYLDRRPSLLELNKLSILQLNGTDKKIMEVL